MFMAIRLASNSGRGSSFWNALRIRWVSYSLGSISAYISAAISCSTSRARFSSTGSWLISSSNSAFSISSRWECPLGVYGVAIRSGFVARQFSKCRTSCSIYGVILHPHFLRSTVCASVFCTGGAFFFRFSSASRKTDASIKTGKPLSPRYLVSARILATMFLFHGLPGSYGTAVLFMNSVSSRMLTPMLYLENRCSSHVLCLLPPALRYFVDSTTNRTFILRCAYAS